MFKSLATTVLNRSKDAENFVMSQTNSMMKRRKASTSAPNSPQSESKPFFGSFDLSSSSMHQVAREGNVLQMEKLVNYQMSLHQPVKKKINSKDENDLTPLHYAAKYGHFAMMDCLIKYGADVQIKGEDDATALHFLAKYKKKEINDQDNFDQFKTKLEDEMGNGVKLLVEHGADVNARDAMGLTPLHQACSRNNIKAVLELLQFKDIDLEETDQQGLTALHLSCLYGRIEIVEILLDNGAMIRCRDKDMTTPFHLCCIEGSENVAKLLIEKARSLAEPISENGKNFATIDENKDNNWTNRIPKFKLLSLTSGSKKFAQQVEEEQKLPRLISPSSLNMHPSSGVKDILLDIDSAKNLPLHLAIENGNFEQVKLCIEEGKKNGINDMINARRIHEDTCFHLAVKSGNIKIIKYLLDENADVNARNCFLVTPLMIGCEHNAYVIVNFLLENGANLELKNSDFMTPLMIACKFGHYETIQCLLEHGANVAETDKDDKTCLMFAAEENKIEALTLLLTYHEVRKLIQEKDKFNNTALHLSSMKGHHDVVKLLIKYKASVDHKNDDDRTTLHVAALFGHETVIPDLVDKDRSIINIGDEESNTALHLAAIAGNLKSVSALIKCGANLEIRNINQMTPLDCACARGWEKIVLVLLDSGANIEPKGIIKISPLHLACQSGHVDVVKILLQRKASVDFRSLDGRNALDFAIDFGQKECALMLVQHETWMKSMKNATVDPVTGQMMTPMRKLIMKMQDVAVVVCNRCIEDNGKKPENEDYEVTLSYELLDDMYTSTEWLAPSTDTVETAGGVSSDESYYSVFDDQNQLTAEAHPYTNEANVLRENHPLQIMVNCESEKLLLHPVVTGLLNYKWKHLGRYVYYADLLCFVAYLAILNAYMMLHPPFYRLNWVKIIQFREYLYNNRDATGLNLNQDYVNEFANDSPRCWYYRSEVLQNSLILVGVSPGCHILPTAVFILKWILFGFSLFWLLREFLQLLHVKQKPFRISSIFEVTLHLFTLLLTLDFRRFPLPDLEQVTAGNITELRNDAPMIDFQYDTGLRQDWQQQIGAIAIFLSWTVLLLFIRKFPRLGIFVVMFTDILTTFSQFFFVFVLFVLAFSFSFTILIGNQYEFERWYEAIVKTATMMVDGPDFGGIFYSAPAGIENIGKDYHLQVYPREITMFIFVVFLITMTIIIMNLLVGLAVGDIITVQENATLKRLGMQVALVLEVEFTLPNFLRKKIFTRQQKVLFYEEQKSNIIKRLLFSSGLSLEMVSKTLEDEGKGENKPRSAEDKVLFGLNLLRGRLSDVLAEQADLKHDVRGVHALVRQSQREASEKAEMKMELEEKNEKEFQTLLSKNVKELDVKVEECRQQVEQTKREIVKAVEDLKTLFSTFSKA